MRNYRKFRFLAIFVVVLSLTFAYGRAEEASCESPEYELMSLLISDEFEEEFSLILINQDTEPWCLGGGLDFLRKDWPRLKSETARQYRQSAFSGSCTTKPMLRLKSRQ